jgi:hypothetical protein
LRIGRQRSGSRNGLALQRAGDVGANGVADLSERRAVAGID